MRRRTVLAVLGAALVALASISPTQAAAPAIRAQSAALEIDVQGFVEVRQLADGTAPCQGGIRYVQTNRFDFDSGAGRRVRLQLLAVPGAATIAASTMSRPAGSADVLGAISDISYTASCPDDGERPTPPSCTSARGKVAMGLVPTSAEELANPGGTFLNISVQRVGGGNDATDCQGVSAIGDAGTLVGPGTEQGEVNSSMGPGLAVTVPSGISAESLVRAPEGKVMKRWITYSGPCSEVRVTVQKKNVPAPTAPQLVADGDCTMTGRLALTIRVAG